MAGNKGGGGKSSGGGSQPSGGGGRPSGGGGQPSGGGGQPSGGGGRPSASSSPSSTPSGGGGARPSASSTPSTPSSGGGGGQSRQEQKVTQATKDIKGMISGITAASPKIADPKAYQKALDVLRGAGKDQRVQTLKEKVSSARTAARTTTTPPPDDKQSPGLTQADIEAAINKFKEGLSPGLSEEDLQSALNTQRETLMSEFGDWKQQYADTTSQMQQQREEPTAASSTPSTDLSATDISSQFEAFDPELFSSLLGELESSKRRQKDWNELSAKAAFKY